MKKQIILSFLALGLACTVLAQPKLSADNIDDVVRAMTLEEKAHMVVGIGHYWGNNESCQSWRDIPGLPGGTYAIPRLGIPRLLFGDGPLGIKMSADRITDSHKYYTTSFPVPLLTASSWDPQVVYGVARGIGEEVRDYGVDVVLGPSINIIRQPLGGRTHEYYSEDPYLAGIMSSAFIRGTQSVGVGASVKHFAANNQESNRGANNAIVGQRTLREIYLKPFEISVKSANPWTVMTSYNSVNGTTSSENRDLLAGVLRGDWGFKGLVMTDWGGGYNPDKQMLAGNDLLEPGTPETPKQIIDAVKNGTLSEQTLNENVERVLQLIVKSHAFHNYKFSNRPDLEAHQTVAREAGAQSAVLLKNDNQTLPLAAKGRAAVYGRTAYFMCTGGIGHFEYNGSYYSVSMAEGMRDAGWDVDFDLAKKYWLMGSNHPVAPWMNGGKQVDTEEKAVPAAELAAQADRNDVAIIVLGQNSGEGSDRTRAAFYFTEQEQQLAKDVTAAYHKVGKRVVLVLNIPGPMAMESIKDIPDAIVCAFQGGEQIGNWVADVLTGKVTPSGKLPVTFAKEIEDYSSSKNYPVLDKQLDISGMMREKPRLGMTQNTEGSRRNIDYTVYEEGIYVGYRYFDAFNVPVTYPFGYGLSYTTFDYSNAAITKTGDTFRVTVDITNTGRYKGAEVVQLYVAAPKGKLEKPVKELRAFAKTRVLQPGESQTLTMMVRAEDLASFNEAKSQWETDKGQYRFLVAAAVDDVKATLHGTVSKKWTKKVSNVLKPQVKIKHLNR